MFTLQYLQTEENDESSPTPKPGIAVDSTLNFGSFWINLVIYLRKSNVGLLTNKHGFDQNYFSNLPTSVHTSVFKFQIYEFIASSPFAC